MSSILPAASTITSVYPSNPQTAPRTISKASYAINLVGRSFSKTEIFDKVLKLINGILMMVQAYWKEIAFPTLKAIETRLIFDTDVIAGVTNLPSRVQEFFIKQNKKTGNLRLYEKGPIKVFSKAMLTVGSTCDSLKLLQLFGVNLASAAAAIGKFPVFNFFVDIGMKVVKDTAVFTSSALSVIDAIIRLSGHSFYSLYDLALTTTHLDSYFTTYKSEGEKVKHENQVKYFKNKYKYELEKLNDFDHLGNKLILLADLGKMGLIFFSNSYVNTVRYGFLIVFTCASAIAKGLVEDLDRDPIEKDIII